MIYVQDLKKQFDKRGIAGVNGITFSLEQGKVMAIMGPNGSGKTSLLKLLSGAATPESGTIKLDGEVSTFPSSDEPEDQNVQKFLIQSVKLLIDEEKKIQLARDLADTFEFTFQLRQKLSELSSGQRQKILLAKDLINRPSLFLMDEPFAHLDPFTRRDILRGLFEYIKHQKMTVLWVTHDLEEAFRFSDVIGLMNFGKFEQIAGPMTMVQKPKNLFVAKFMGYRNFFPAKRADERWTCSLGDFEMSFDGRDEAILVVPDHAWTVGEGQRALVTGKHPGRQTIEYTLELESKPVTLVQGSQLPLYENHIYLAPKWTECFLITL